ncbi:uncharacterized protein LOC111371953 [Olea europaea var. sylvestris]|uniref:uncharacterized protein LOC111371953 n=1 Tax=Olea europaea var. sylvestris TaxID=158386 RepID=UPI000C1CFAFE|nr:uncharacterized protein LOC111371953 [Olea europaea var. sylvestris]
MVGELSYFLGLQVKQTDCGLFISQSKYAKNLVKRFGLDSKEHKRTPMSTSIKLGHDPTASRPSIAFSVGVCARFQADPKDSHLSAAGNVDDRKSTSGGCFYVGSNLVSWMSKKQNLVSLSTAEAEYIAAGSCCTQQLWMKQMLSDYEINQGTMIVFLSIDPIGDLLADFSAIPPSHSHALISALDIPSSSTSVPPLA